MWCYSHFLLIFVSFVTSFAHKLPANNSTTNGGTDGIAVPVIETTIDSGMYSENGTDLMTPEDLPDLLSDGIVLSFANTTETDSDSDSTLIDSEDLQRCIDMPDRSCSAQRGNLCSYSFWDIPFSFLNTVHDIFGMTNMGNCAVMAGDKVLFIINTILLNLTAIQLYTKRRLTMLYNKQLNN
ncbi:CFC_HP_G0001230.mRNA.1.CDS.1 [Saccharomyces cerevisiae]|nr:CFC_HP_G0001230.mRNA.1.CDS.1 [Saccharomyces cerevisiae]CAI6934108.1 CFC_HP_G0001230.mRNA.1.CDS.1 [Saccharomyces cerevisiae]